MNLYRIIEINRTEFDNITEPVSLVAAKAWLKVTFSDDDALLTEIIKRARIAVGNFILQSIVPTRIITLVELCLGNRETFMEFLLPYGPVLNAKTYGVDYVGVNYKNGPKQSDFEAKTADVDFYYDGITQPVLKLIVPGVYKFMYDAGYDNNVPYDLIEAILSEVAFRYEHRGDEMNYTERLLCPAARSKAKPYKIMSWS
jgi:hypothetical protein